MINSRPFFRPQINSSASLPKPNIYVLALQKEYKDFVVSEESAHHYQGLWSSAIFANNNPIDLEIGTGNGLFFTEHLLKNPNRNLLGVELKFKPLVQTIRRALSAQLFNGQVLRHHAFNIDLVFAPEELDDIYIQFPDPWTTPRKPQNRILNSRMLEVLFRLQKPNSFLEFKTDSAEAFFWSMENIRNSSYQVVGYSEDLHAQQIGDSETPRFKTQFENIFVRKGLPIFYVRILRPKANSVVV